MADTRTLEELIESFKTQYANNYQSDEAIAALIKTFKSTNITVENWNTLVHCIQNINELYIGNNMLPNILDALNESLNTKVNKTGDTINGNLTVTGQLSLGTWTFEENSGILKLGKFISSVFSSLYQYTVNSFYQVGNCDLGNVLNPWKDVYISGVLSDGTNEVAVADIITNSDLTSKEDKSNKVTLGSTNTATQYPNAKSVWDNLQNVRAVAEGKCNSFVLMYEFEEVTEEELSAFFKANGDAFEDMDDFWDYVGGQSSQCMNLNFNSSEETVNFVNISGASYIAFMNKDYTFSIYNKQDCATRIKTGDVFIVMETDVPDRWAYDALACKLETSINLNNYYTKGEADSIFQTKLTFATNTQVDELFE